MRAERLRIWTGLAVISLVWGSTWLAIKIGLASVPPFLGVGIRFLIASGLLFVILRAGRIRIPLTADAKILYASLTLLTFTVPFALVYWAQQYVASGLGSVLFAAFPFWVALFSQLLLPGEKLNGFKAAGIVLGFTGIVIIFAHDIRYTGEGGILPLIAIVVSTILQALSTILVSRYGKPVSPVAMNFVGMLAGGVALTLLGLLTESTNTIVWDGAAVGSILYLAIFGSVVAFVTYHWLLKRIEAVYISFTTFINPIIAVILGAAVLGERLASSTLAGAACVLGGILVANGRSFLRRREERP
jgi:drug/metabolite transporter (DMT)-like permease